jgi:hypothetical protein
VGAASANQIGNQLTPKSDIHVLQNPVSDREGGETIADATPIPGLPYSDSGATCDNVNNYDAVCPYSGSTSADVVYSLELTNDVTLTVDLCGSGYDTKTYVLDAALNVLACNDDFYFDSTCGVYVSKIENAAIPGGQTVYIVIDGYGGDCGEYLMDVSGEIFIPCVIDCTTSTLEGEPELMDGYQDSYNGGCNSPAFGNPFQDLEGTGDNMLSFCGKGGWYLFNGNNYRDTDWFTAVFAEDGAGVLELELCVEAQTYLFELGPQDCGSVGVLQSVLVDPLVPGNMTIFGAPGNLAWIWVGSSVFAAPPGFGHEYDYQLWITGIQDGIIATEDATWSQVKGMYR